MRILVIEDDDAIASVLERGLAAEGFEVERCADGPSGLYRAIDPSFCAIVLDLLLPGKSGYWVCEQLRAEGVRTPILVLTSKDGELDQVDLLDLGADDFLTKPASLAVIAARLRVLLRRSASSTSNLVVRGALSYDLRLRRCTVDGHEVTLTKREDQLLRSLLLADAGCLTRTELLDAVWGAEAEVDPSIVDIYLRKLRTKLEGCAIENVRGLGYRISAQ